MSTATATKPKALAPGELNDVEIFRAGTYQVFNEKGEKEEITYTAEDAVTMAENANALLEAGKHTPPAKLGHDEKQQWARLAGLPAVGWVSKVRAEGSRVFADFKQVPETVMDAIRKGGYKFISSEVYSPAQTAANFGDTVKGITLRAVALLGADVPVIKGMNPIMFASVGEKFTSVSIGIDPVAAAKFAEDGEEKEKFKPLMIPANRHPHGALVKMADDDEPYEVQAIHRDGTYDIGDHKNPWDEKKKKKSIAHENLSLLSEVWSQQQIEAYKAKPQQEDAMDAAKFAESEQKRKDAEEATKLAEKAAAEATAQLLAEREKTAKIEARLLDDRIAAFAEKHKTHLTPAMRPVFDALCKAAVAAPIKFAEGGKDKEVSHVEAVFAFAESLIKGKAVILGEVIPAGKDDKGKEADVKLAEARFKPYAEANNMEIVGAELSAAAKEYAEKNKVAFTVALKHVAAVAAAQGV